MKNKTKTKLLYLTITLLVAALAFTWWYRPAPETVEVEIPVAVPVEVRAPAPQPEFRNAPIKKYKPGYTQQMGLLIGPADETLPLYGKQTRAHRDRYNYYTTTGGENLYPVPITHNARECTEDIGCQEFYGGEMVNVLDKTYEVKIYRTDDFF